MAKKERMGTESRKSGEKTVRTRSMVIGFWSGMLFSLAGIFMYYFNFAEVAPKTFLLRSWSAAKWTEGWLGDVISIGMAGLLSILIAFIYYVLLRKLRSMWAGVVYGMIIWGIIFYILHPVFSSVPPLMELSEHTIVSTACLFILYGTFIGYSISFDYHDMLIKEKKNKKMPN